jgi:predicted RND superfamily exporter protein
MKNIRDDFESYFGRLGLFIFEHRFSTLVFVFGILVVLLLQLGTLTIDTSNDAFYHADDPVRIEYNQFREQFGKDDHIIIGLNSNNIFTEKFLLKMQQLHLEIEEKVPFINKVKSLLNIRNTYGIEDELIIEELIETIPQTSEQLDALKIKSMSNPFYVNYLLTKDGQFTFIDIEPVALTTSAGMEPSKANQLKFISTVEYSEMMDELLPILAKYQDQDMKIFVTGFPVITDKLTRSIEQTLVDLTPLTVLFNLLFLTLLFRRFSGVIYPTIIMIITIVSTVGIMTWLSISIDLVTTILPTLLSVVAIADSVHLMSTFYQRFDSNGGDKKDAIVYAMEQNGLAILMTSVTTAIGLTSLILADIAPVANLGIVAPLGIMLAFIYTVLLLPALIAIFPIKKVETAYALSGIVDQMIDWVADVTLRRYKGIFMFSIAIIIVSIVGAAQLKLSHNSLNWLPDDTNVRVDTSIIDKALGGSMSIEIVIDTGKQNGVYQPELLKRLNTTADMIGTLGSDQVAIGKSYSLHVVIKEVNRALHGNKQEHYVVPDNSKLIAQELFLFELSAADDLHKLVDSDYSKVRFTIMIPFVDAIQIKPVLDNIKQHFYTNYPDEKIIVTGIAPMLVETMHSVITTMFKSYGFALFAITLLMIVLIGKLKLGLISMVPNLMPVIMIMGLMGWLGMPFDFSNMMVGSVVIGLVVDDTIHFLHNLRRHFDRTGDVKIAVSKTLHTTGRAIFITSLVLVSGMAVAMTSELSSTANFGLITACAILFALLADFFLVPALMYATYKKNISEFI